MTAASTRRQTQLNKPAFFNDLGYEPHQGQREIHMSQHLRRVVAYSAGPYPLASHGLGDLFVIRVAGNIAAPSQIGSVEFAAIQFGTRLVIVLGHSMGSFVLQQLLFEHPGGMIAAALSGSNGRPPAIAALGKLVARIERARVGRRNPSPVLQRLTFNSYNRAFAPARTEFDWLSRDPEEVDAYIADPLCGFPVSTQTWLDMLNSLGRIADPSNVAKIPKGLPLYLFAGDRDPVGDSGKGMKTLRDAYTRAGIADVRLELYPDGRHEMLNETNRDEVMADFIAWCDEMVAARG